MTVSLTTRLGIHRWTDDADPWDREHFDDDNAALEELVVIGGQGLNAARPAAGVERRMFLATDAERVYIDDGDEWYELLVLGTGGTVPGSVDFTGTTLTRNGTAVATTTDVTSAANALATALSDHITDTTAAHAASAIGFTPAGDVAATDVQAAIAELASEKATAAALTAHTGAAAGAHAASAISYAGSTNLAATDVEAALDELDAEKLALAGGTVTGLVTFNAGIALPNGQDLTVGTGTGSKIGQAASKLGFYGATPVGRQGTYNLTGSADRTLGAYSSDAESTPYTGIDNTAAGTVFAQVTDLNALRTAYETLRAYVEDLGGVVIGTVTDLKTEGLLG